MHILSVILCVGVSVWAGFEIYKLVKEIRDKKNNEKGEKK